eukprot:846201-Amphidinium_carterae.1
MSLLCPKQLTYLVNAYCFSRAEQGGQSREQGRQQNNIIITSNIKTAASNDWQPETRTTNNMNTIKGNQQQYEERH